MGLQRVRSFLCLASHTHTHTVNLRVTHAVVYQQPLPLTAEWQPPYGHTTDPASVDGHSACSQCSAVTTLAAVNIHITVLSGRKLLDQKKWNHLVSVRYNLLRTCQMVSKVVGPFYAPVVRALVPPQPCQHLERSDFLVLARPLGKCAYAIFVLTFPSLQMSDVGQFSCDICHPPIFGEMAIPIFCPFFLSACLLYIIKC